MYETEGKGPVQVDAFTTERFKGNPAGVIPNADGLSDAQMQAIARELNNSEIAFILSPTGDDHEVWIRFFTPAAKVPSCGHATIAAYYVRALENKLGSGTVWHKIGIGVLPVEIINRHGEYKVVMTQGKIEVAAPFGGAERSVIIAALALSEPDLNARCPIQIVSTGHGKVLVGIKKRDKLNALQPDLSRLAGISRMIGCNGFFVFTFDSDSPAILTCGRMFAPAIGVSEDLVTGNANGPPGAYIDAKPFSPSDWPASRKCSALLALIPPGSEAVSGFFRLFLAPAPKTAAGIPQSM